MEYREYIPVINNHTTSLMNQLNTNEREIDQRANKIRFLSIPKKSRRLYDSATTQLFMYLAGKEKRLLKTCQKIVHANQNLLMVVVYILLYSYFSSLERRLDNKASFVIVDGFQNFPAEILVHFRSRRTFSNFHDTDTVHLFVRIIK